MTIVKNVIEKILSPPFENHGLWWIKVKTDIHSKFTLMNLSEKAIRRHKVGSEFYEAYP